MWKTIARVCVTAMAAVMTSAIAEAHITIAPNHSMRPTSMTKLTPRPAQ